MYARATASRSQLYHYFGDTTDLLRAEAQTTSDAVLGAVVAEVARLSKEKGKAEGEIWKFDAKLGNADFVARAPEEIIEENRERREAEAARLAKIEEALARLSGD